MMHATEYPKLMLASTIGNIVSFILVLVGVYTGNVVLSTIFTVLVMLLNIFVSTLSLTLVNKLSNELVHEIEDAKPIVLSNDDIKRLGKACEKLDKYNVDYNIDYTTRDINAYVTIGLYTRMSVADNLDSSVKYHIIGTDKILVKQND